jgi:ubiquinone/menaquinone biosynthesis C-methylase UbiE
VPARPLWQLPPGVSRGTWDYIHLASIADDYDSYFKEHPLLRLDMQIVERFLPKLGDTPPIVGDFGCGTARVAKQLAPQGYRVLNVDMSLPMLKQATANDLDSAMSVCVRGNLVQLDWLRDRSLAMAVCLFSSIGMIRGRSHRRAFLKHVHRCLCDGAVLVLHVHNRMRSLFDPGGIRWLLNTHWKSWTGNTWEFGDRVYNYRGLPAMFLHIYSQNELVQDLRSAGFSQFEVLPINATASELLQRRTFFANVRAGGFFAIARR